MKLDTYIKNRDRIEVLSVRLTNYKNLIEKTFKSYTCVLVFDGYDITLPSEQVRAIVETALSSIIKELESYGIYDTFDDYLEEKK